MNRFIVANTKKVAKLNTWTVTLAPHGKILTKIGSVAFWVIRKLWKVVEENDVLIEFKTMEFNNDKLLDYILDCQDNIERIYYNKVEKILVGPKQAFNLTHELLKTSPTGVVETWLSHGSNNELLGIKIQVVPWLDGVVLVPKEDRI